MDKVQSGNQTTPRSEKRQPWKAIWPQSVEEGSSNSAQFYYGFKKGQIMKTAGNAGDFFAKGDWKVEHDTAA